MGATTLTLPSDTEIVVERVLEAPRELVWRAWTDPGHLPKWWGPAGFRTTTRELDVRPGGRWRFTMHGPDGRDYENLITFQEVKQPERIAYKHGGDRDVEPVNFSVVATFVAEGAARTRLTLRMIFVSKEARGFVMREYNAGEGGKQTVDRLAAHVEAMRAAGATAPKPFEIVRVVRATREAVWRVWSEERFLSKWIGPAGASITASSLDFRVGGRFMCHMEAGPGEPHPPHWGRWDYREISAPERLVFTVAFSDEAGKTVRSPYHGAWPLEILSTVTLHEHAGKGGGTVVTVRWEPIGATAAEAGAFEKGHSAMHAGWGGSLDKLEALVARGS